MFQTEVTGNTELRAFSKSYLIFHRVGTSCTRIYETCSLAIRYAFCQPCLWWHETQFGETQPCERRDPASVHTITYIQS